MEAGDVEDKKEGYKTITERMTSLDRKLSEENRSKVLTFILVFIITT